MRRSFALLATFSLMLVIGLSIVSAAITPEQKQMVVVAAGALNKCEALIKAEKYDEAAKLLPDIQNAATQIAAIPELAGPSANLIKRISAIRAEFDLQGITLPEFVKPEPAKPLPPGAKPPAGMSGEVSFVKHIAPFLVAKCGKCHVTGTKGQLNFASYELIEKGFQGKLLLMKGDAKNSEGVRSIESGDMPRGGTKVSPEELAMFKKWIDDGAKFDGPDPKAQLTALTAAAPGTPARPAEPTEPKLETMSATGRETVSFSKDVAPILAETCYNCHGGGQQLSGALSFATIGGLLKGGDSGNAIVPGKPAESLLVKKIKGTAGDRMPLNAAALSAAQIALFEKWIAEGAKYDGGDQTLNVVRLVAMVRAKNATHDELSKARMERNDAKWRLAISDEQPEIVEGKNFIVIGNAGLPTLKTVSQMAEAQAAVLAGIYKLDPAKPVIKGRGTLYVLKRKIDYAEWKMVEEREIPTAIRGHLRYDVVDSYGVMWPPADDKEFSLKTLVNEQVAGLIIAEMGQGKLPIWFYNGAGRAVAAASDSRDPRVKGMDAAAKDALAATANPVDLTAGKLGGEGAELVALAFSKYLTGGNSKFNTMLADIRAGADLDTALQRNYGGNAAQLIAGWTGKGMMTKKGK